MRILLALVLILAASSAGRSAPIPACTYGRWAFGLHGGSPFTTAVTTGWDVVVLGDPQTAWLSISDFVLPDGLRDLCPPPGRVTYKGTPKGAKVTARWSGCGYTGLGKVLLRGLVRRDCAGFRGQIKSNLADRRGWMTFWTYPSRCGDGIVDRGLSEACDPGTILDSCTFQPGTCQPDCRCR